MFIILALPNHQGIWGLVAVWGWQNHCRFLESSTLPFKLDHALALCLLQEDQGVYQGKVRDMISDNQYRLIVSVNDLRRKNEKRASRYVWPAKRIGASLQLHSAVLCMLGLEVTWGKASQVL